MLVVQNNVQGVKDMIGRRWKMGIFKKKKSKFSKVTYPEEEMKKKEVKKVIVEEEEEVEEEEVVEEEPEKEIVAEEKRKTIIVKELPVQPLREIKLEDGTMADLFTIEEYLTKLANEEED